MSDLAYRSLPWHGAEIVNVKTFEATTLSKNSECENIFEVIKNGHKNSVIWNKKDYGSIHVDQNHIKSNQYIPGSLTNIRSINNSADIHEIEKILTSMENLVHTPSTVPAQPTFLLYSK